MDFNQLHFAHPLWLWGGITIPLVWMLFFLFYRVNCPRHQLEKYIDSHLLPYLLVKEQGSEGSHWKTLLLWSIAWSCLTLALAGPRWNLREIDTFSQDQSLVIALDLSESMNATDIKPSRLIRAKQKIEDLLKLSKGVKIGLIAFAADPHMITPITEDKETILHLLPTLETNLIYVQGSRLTSALDMASSMLDVEPGNNKMLLVISDGGFEDSSAIITAKKLAEKGIVIHTMGVGTFEGAPVQNVEKNKLQSKSPIISKLEKERLNEISKAGNGRYLEAYYSDHEEIIILKELEKRADSQMNIGKKKSFWDERFYLMILPALPIILWWFRRGMIFAVFLIFFASPFKLEAANATDYFKNSEELGKQACDDGDYDTASRTFQDPYRKGVAYYKAKNYSEAEKMFRQSSREDVASNAAYNLGNTLVQQQKLKKAIKAYEEVLKKWPDHIKAKENLEIIKKMLDQQKQNSPNSENSDQQDDDSENDPDKQDESGSESKDNDKSENPESKDSPDSDSSQDNEKQDNHEGSDEQEPPQEKQDHLDSLNENHEDSSGQQEGHQKLNEAEAAQENPETKSQKSQEDQDADLWLNRISNDPKAFLKNKFQIESKRNGTKEGVDPW